MNRYGWLIPFILIGCTGCLMWPTSDRTYGPDPISPKLPRLLLGERTVESLKSTFQWKAAFQNSVITYDLIIYEIVGSHTDPPIPWKEVYYREGLSLPKHQMEEPLHPGKRYYWSVRVHQGARVSDWSRFSSGICGLFLIGAGLLIVPMVDCDRTEYPFHIFRTPDVS